MFLSVARNKSAEIVGFSYTRSDGFATAYIGDTHVLPEYRHQGIAHALKEANYDALASACPLVREVVTSTDVKNSIMLRVNKSFGFVPVATTVHLRMHIEHGQC
jgi:ribosomal protein S18 acetylase RimI-like enzyme